MFEDDGSEISREALGVSEKEPKKPAEAEKPKNGFNELSQGKHVRLACKCDGFISAIHPCDEEEGRWFSIIHTIVNCGSKNFAKLYGEGQLTHKSTFRYDVFKRVFPFEEIPAPTWFPSLEAGPVLANDFRYIAVWMIKENLTFLVAGAGLKMNAYMAATTLRERLGPESVEIFVLENMGSLKEATKMAEEIWKSPPAANSVRNGFALKEWILANLIANHTETTFSPMGKSPLTADEITSILKTVAEHPAYNKQKVAVLSSEGKQVLLSNGEVTIS